MLRPIFLLFLLIATGPNVLASEKYTAVSAGNNFACAITTSGKVTCWGDNQTVGWEVEHQGTRLLPPSNLKNPSSISSGTFACVLSEGQPKCWPSLAGPIPLKLRDIKKISVGSEHFCGIDANSEVQCIGKYRTGPYYGDFKPAYVPADLGQVIDISVFGNRSCAANEKGVRCWGADSTDKYISFLPTSKPIQEIATGKSILCLLFKGGSVECYNQYRSSQIAVPSDLGKAKSLAVGDTYACAIDMSNNVRCWNDEFGKMASFPQVGQVLSITAGNGFACAITIQNKIECWHDGDRTFGKMMPPSQFGIGKEIATSGVGSCTLFDSGKIECLPSHRNNNSYYSWASSINPLLRYKKIVASTTFTCGITEDNKVNCWGIDYPEKNQPVNILSSGDYGLCTVDLQDIPRCWKLDLWGKTSEAHFPNRNYGNIISIANYNGTVFCLINSNHDLFCEKDHDLSWTLVTPPTSIGKVLSITIGQTTACAIKENKEIECWQYKKSSELPVSAPPKDFPKAKQIVNYNDLFCALVIYNQVLCWDNTGIAQNLPDDSLFNKSTINSISMSGFQGSHSICALRDNGVQCEMQERTWNPF